MSFITTIHNREAYLAGTIESILAQTDPHFTLLLWDDGSIDQSPQIAQQYAHQDPRIQLIRASHQGAAPKATPRTRPTLPNPLLPHPPPTEGSIAVTSK